MFGRMRSNTGGIRKAKHEIRKKTGAEARRRGSSSFGFRASDFVCLLLRGRGNLRRRSGTFGGWGRADLVGLWLRAGGRAVVVGAKFNARRVPGQPFLVRHEHHVAGDLLEPL